jgi:hypothetical protein
MFPLREGDQTTRALAIAVLLKRGRDVDIELVERELKLAQEVDEEWY